MKPIILLDMDGVLADFFNGVFAQFGLIETIDHIKLEQPWPYDVAQWLVNVVPRLAPLNRISITNMCASNPQFWCNLAIYPDARQFVTYLMDRRYDVIVTSAPQDHKSHIQKLEWLEHWFPELIHTAFIDRKELMANSRHILIDDHDENCRKFEDRGGYAIVYPQPWNSAYMFVKIRQLYVQHQLSILSRYADRS